MGGLLVLNSALIFFLITSLVYLAAVGGVLKNRGWREGQVKLLVVYCLGAFFWTVIQALRVMNLPFVSDVFLPRLLLYGLLVLSVLFLQLNRSFLRQTGWTVWLWWGLGVIWLTLCVLLIEPVQLFPDPLPIGAGIVRSAAGTAALFVGWGVFMGSATFMVIRGYRRIQQPLHRNRIKYWSLALAVTVAGAGSFLLGAPLSGSLLYLFGVLNAAYAVLTYDLPDVREAFRRVFSALIWFAVATAIYWGVLLLQPVLISIFPEVAPWIWAGLTALVLAVLVTPVLRFIRSLVNKWVSQGGYDSARLLRDYSMSISNVLDLQRLALISTGVICSGMGIRRGALFVVHQEAKSDEGAVQPQSFSLRGIGGIVPDGKLLVSDPLGSYFSSDHRCLNQYDIDLLPRFRGLDAEIRSWLKKLDMDVYVPIYAKGEWIGLFALGPKLSGDRYFDEDLAVLNTLADQTAVALENARLFDDLKERTDEIQRLNDELTLANQELARLDQAKTDFITIASHELRTPLTRIRGYNDILGQMVRTGALSQETAEQLTQGVSKAVLHLEDIVNTMFLVSKISTSTLTLNVSLTSISSIVRTAADSWNDALTERKQSLSVERMDEMPYIMADGKRLKEAFSHLVQNAIKYTPDGGRIAIRGYLMDATVPPEEQLIELVVSDSGIGVAPENRERIFEKFYRASDVSLHSTSGVKFKGAGPGLGLTIARGIIEAHGGRIWVESPGFDEQLCPGSEFHVILPVQARGAAAEGVETGDATP